MRKGSVSSRKFLCLSGVLGVFVVLTVGLTLLLVMVENRQRRETADSTPYARASIKGDGLDGVVHFVAKGSSVKVTAEIFGLEPLSEHALHILEFGEAGKEGAIFSPIGTRHSCPGDGSRQVGDLGNIKADAEGVGRYEHWDELVRLGGVHGVVGRSVVVRANKDDCLTQPHGNAGDVIARGTVLVGDPAAVRTPPPQRDEQEPAPSPLEKRSVALADNAPHAEGAPAPNALLPEFVRPPTAAVVEGDAEGSVGPAGLGAIDADGEGLGALGARVVGGPPRDSVLAESAWSVDDSPQ